MPIFFYFIKLIDMNFIELVKKRRSVRKYLQKPVERTEILKCVEAARFAPSAEHVQPWRYLIIDDPNVLKKVADSAFTGVYKFTKFASKAPVLVLILARLDILANKIGKQIQGTQYYLIDIGISGEHFVLQAAELGIGTCWIGWFNEKKLRQALNIPKKYKIVSLISMGYFDNNFELKEKHRKGLEEIHWFNEISS
ncbi:nitroreductase family protein [candidate division KSB1 bacterium]